MSVPGSIGLVHDYLLVLRGAERAFAGITDCYPGAPLYTLLYDEEGTGGRFADRHITTSYLQRTGIRQRGFRRLLPLFPRAIERLPVQEHALIVSSSSAFAHGVRPKPGAVHVCYCYTPFRYAWHERDRALAEVPRPLRPLLSRQLSRVRRWDVKAAARVTHYVAISELARERIQRFYGRDASVIHPPVEVERFAVGKPQDYLLVVCELVRHKRVEVALEAARSAGSPVKVVGSGPDEALLRAEYGASAEFVGRASDDALAELYAGARALLVPNVEEFGIAAVEAQAAGRPVIATRAGGVLETVVDGETGVLVDGDVESFATAIRDDHLDRLDPERIRANADRFSIGEFRRRFAEEVDRVVAQASATARSTSP